MPSHPIPIVLLTLVLGGCASMPEVLPVTTDLPQDTRAGIVYALPKTEVLLALPLIQTAHTRAPLLPEAESGWVEYARELYRKLGIKPSEIELQTMLTFRLTSADAALAPRAVPDPSAIFHVGLLSKWPLENKLSLKLDSSLVLFSADTSSSNQAISTALKVVETAVSIGILASLDRTPTFVQQATNLKPASHVVTVIRGGSGTIASAGAIQSEPDKFYSARKKSNLTLAIDEVLRLRAKRKELIETNPIHRDAGQLQIALDWIAKEELRYLHMLTGTTETKSWVGIARFVPNSGGLIGDVATLHPTFGFKFETAAGVNADLNPFRYSATTKQADGSDVPTISTFMSIEGKSPDSWVLARKAAMDAKLSVKVEAIPALIRPGMIPEPAVTNRSYAYRVPATCIVSGAKDGTVFVQKEMPIPQLGLTRYLPRRLNGISGSLNFELNPETGSLNKITSESKPADLAAATSSVGESAKAILNANDELAKLTREQKILEAQKAIKDLKTAP